MRHLQPLDPHWLRAAGKDEVVSCVSSNLFEGVILLLKVVKVGGRNTDASTPAGLVDADDAIRVLVREWTEQHGMQNTKDRGIYPDPQCQSQDGHGREAWTLT